MKILSLLFILLTFTSFSQELHSCKHVKATKPGASPAIKRSSNPLMDNYDVKFYNIDLDVSNLSTYIFGFAEMKIETKTDNFDKIVVDFSNSFSIDSVLVNGIKVNSTKGSNILTIQLGIPVTKNTLLNSKIYYRGFGKTDNYFPVGMQSESNSYGKKYTYTTSEPYQSYLWWPCKQELNDQADSVYINITTEATNQVAANGLLKKVVDINGNQKRFEWKTYYPIDYYLIAFSTGPYVVYNSYAKPVGSNDSILIQDFVYTSAEYTKYKSVIDQTKKLIEVYSAKFGLYPFSKEKYGHFMTPSQIGALENQTMTMIGDNYNFSTVAHELAHQWFGNNVTCSDWKDIWLHEGFAEYFGKVLGNELLNNTLDNTQIKSVQNKVFLQKESQISLNDSQVLDPNQIFNYVNSYGKGATVLHMLRYEIGDALFFKVLADFYNTYKGKNVSTDNLLSIVNTVTAKDYTYFFNQWIYGKGHPVYNVLYSQKGDTVYIESTQSSSSSAQPIFFKMKVDFRVNNLTSFNFIQTKAKETFKIYLPGNSISSLSLDPDYWNLLEIKAIRPKGTECLIKSFSFNSLNATGTIYNDSIVVKLPYNTSITNLKASFTNSVYSTVTINNVKQVSGVTSNNFTQKIIYTVTAEDGTTKQYTVIVHIAPYVKSSDKLITSITLSNNNATITGTMNGNVITFKYPLGVTIGVMKASFTLSTKASLYVGSTVQVSGSTSNDFSKSIVYTVVAEDGTTKDYTLVFIFDSTLPSAENELVSFGFLNVASESTIKFHDVIVYVPFGTDITKLIATYTLSPKATLLAGNKLQTSGVTENNFFTAAFIYNARAENGFQYYYSVKVIVLPYSGCKLLEFGFLNFSAKATIGTENVEITLPKGTDITKLKPVYKITDSCDFRFENETLQNSGINEHDFTNKVMYSVVPKKTGIPRFYYVQVRFDTLTPTDTTGTSNPTDTTGTTTSLNELNHPTIACYPNPTSGEFYVSADAGSLTISVTDLQGREVYHYENATFTNDKTSINVSDLGVTSYIVNITNNGVTSIHKLEVIE